ALDFARRGLDCADEELEQTGTTRGLGGALHVLALLTSHPAFLAEGASTEVRTLLDRADRNTAGRPFAKGDQVAALRAKFASAIGDPEAVRAARVAEVERVAARAELGDDLLRVIQLQA